MLPVLEDAVLARRAAEGQLDVIDLLLYSAVCGTGLDTIPLPGDTPPEALAALLLDLAALSSRLDKPLTARLMPIPGKQAGDLTGFDFAYFANSRVLALKAGLTTSGQAATASHTGALAGAHAAFRAACRQAGVIEVESIQALFNGALALSYQPLPRGNRIALVTNAGGPAALGSAWRGRTGSSSPSWTRR